MNVRRAVYQDQAGDAGGAGGGGGQGGGGQAAFADAAAARGYLKDYVNDEGVLKAVGDDKVIPWATHVKGKVDQLGTQFPQNWREQLAGKERVKDLEKFAAPKNLYDSYLAFQQRMSSGELKAVTAFPEKGTDEQKAAWRTENGVPATPADYVKGLKLADGVELGEDDKKVLEGFAGEAHKSNMRPEQFGSMAAFFLQEKVNRANARAESDATHMTEVEDALRAEWQGDYRGNVGRITGLLDLAPKGVKDLILNARGADGRALMNNVDVVKALVDWSRQINPSGTLLPGSDGNIAKSVDDEIKQIEDFMRKDRTAYNKDEGKQKRLRELYAARDKLGTKKAA